MTLVERFIEINGWSTSRKTALASGLIMLSSIIVTLIVDLVLPQLHWLDAQRMHDYFWLSDAMFGLVFLLSLAVALRGREGRWTFFLLVIPTGVMLAGLIWMLGGASTAVVALWPCVVLAGTLLYGAREGALMFLYGIGLTVLMFLLQTYGFFPFAPFILDRSLDVQRSGSFVAIVMFAVIGMFGLCFAMTALLLIAQQRQQAMLDEAHRKLDRSARLISRYVPAQVAEQIMADGNELGGLHERRKLTVFFSDLVGFTDIAEELEPEDLSKLLNEYFSEMTAIAQKHGGTVDELSGDAILIFFGAPQATSDKDHALRAVRMAMEMQQTMSVLNAKWRAAGITEALQVRMGINTGVVTVGNFGSPERMKYAALGKHVNLAARLQAQCEPGKVLLSPATWLLVNNEIPCMQHGEMQLKGIPKPVMTYELALKQ